MHAAWEDLAERKKKTMNCRKGEQELRF